MMNLQKTKACIIAILATILLSAALATDNHGKRPNILWIYIEDMNPSLGCYGDFTVPTPNTDKIAEEGVLFENCYVPTPVCSPTRSSIITGKMPTTVGVHNHDGSYTKLPDYLEGNTLPEIFRKYGYAAFNQGKDHYNFIYKRENLYSIGHQKTNKYAPWRNVEDKSKPFFGQIQIQGGKNIFLKNFDELNTTHTSNEAAAKTLPPYYPNNEVFLKHWALHYDCINVNDKFTGIIIDELKKDGLLENTIVFFFSDHGCYLPRHKQFCYEGGLHVPFIVRAPEKYSKAKKNSRRSDLISALDIAATSLSFAKINIPDWYDSKDLFAKDYKREYVIASKDRMDFTIDRVRSLRTEDGYKYIRNFWTDRPYMQFSYKYGGDYTVTMDSLFARGELSEVQARFWSSYQPAEELYDLNSDPHETVNLEHSPTHQNKLIELREDLNKWIEETDDQGQYPESQENLRKVYEKWSPRFPKIWGKPFHELCKNPEYDFLKE